MKVEGSRPKVNWDRVKEAIDALATLQGAEEIHKALAEELLPKYYTLKVKRAMRAEYTAAYRKAHGRKKYPEYAKKYYAKQRASLERKFSL